MGGSGGTRINPEGGVALLPVGRMRERRRATFARGPAERVRATSGGAGRGEARAGTETIHGSEDRAVSRMLTLADPEGVSRAAALDFVDLAQEAIRERGRFSVAL